MVDTTIPGVTDVLTDMEVSFEGIPASDLYQTTVAEAWLNESLLTPGLQTAIKVHSYYHNLPIKNINDFKGKYVNLTANRPILATLGLTSTQAVRQLIYRVDSRGLINDRTEEYTIRCCDPSLLVDAATLVSKQWKCTSPSDVVSDVLTNCAGVQKLDLESACCPRDYIAENIHPFQVVSQQAGVALANGNSPSFIHFMTYENGGTHHFRSLDYLTSQGSIFEYYYADSGIAGNAGYANPHGIMTHSFPCDFDLLSDILNGLDPSGKDINSLALINPLLKQFSLFGAQTLGCGVGSGVLKIGITNFMSAQQQNACPDYAQFYALKRQARMALLEQDKIALRLTVPYYPDLHAGKVITLKLHNANDSTQLNYGSGDYLIVSITHNLKQGGFSTTSMDCVAKTVGVGIQ